MAKELGVQERVRRRIVIYSALGILAIGLIVSLVSILPLYSRLKKAQENNLKHAVKIKAMAVEEYLSRAKDIALQIRSRTQLRKELEEYNRGELNLQEMVGLSRIKLIDAMKHSSEIAGISRLDRSGRLLFGAGLPLPKKGRWPIPPNNSRDVVVHGPFSLGNDRYFLVGANVLGEKNNKLGTDIVVFKIDRLRRIVEDSTGLGETGETILATREGDRIYLLSPTRRGKGYGLEYVPKETPIGTAIERSIRKKSGILISQHPSGNEMIVAYDPVQDMQWGIAVKMEARELYSPVNRQIILLGSIILVLILLGTFGTVLLIRPLMDALEKELAEHKRAEEEKQKLQSQLLQSQKLESIGRLAGGVAHDFNNLLSAIIGYSGLALREMPKDHPVRKQIKTIEEAGKRGAALVRQLLAFSRKQVLRIAVVNLNTVIENLAKMLSVMIGEDVVLELRTSRPVGSIMADSGQIEQVLMNLAVNARDAMPGGGHLLIETADVTLSEEYAKGHQGVKAGHYVMLSVTDTGVGVAREIRDKIFEPFFTTKETGKGTGLGLATVYGIVKQHHGYIWCYSEPDKGTTFKIYLPAARGEAAQPAGEEGFAAAAPGTETVLVVDDESTIRKLVLDMLQPLGYRLLEASCGREALQVSDAFDGSIDLLLTDVILPEMNGRELAREFNIRRPTARVLFMSGYTDNVIAHRGVLEPGVAFIEKPLTRDVLAEKVRKVLDGKS